MKYSIIYLISILIITESCSEAKKEPEKSEYEIKQDKKKELKSLNKDEALKLSQKYYAITNWDDSASFTYKLQERLEDTVISFTGFISDIIENRNDPFKKYGGQQIKNDPLGILKTYILKVASINSECIAEILVNKLQLEELESKFLKDKFQTGCFIFKVRDIKSMFPIMTADGDADIHGGNDEYGYDYDVTSYLTYDYKTVIIRFRGDLIDYYVYKRE